MSESTQAILEVEEAIQAVLDDLSELQASAVQRREAGEALFEVRSELRDLIGATSAIAASALAVVNRLKEVGTPEILDQTTRNAAGVESLESALTGFDTRFKQHEDDISESIAQQLATSVKKVQEIVRELESKLASSLAGDRESLMDALKSMEEKLTLGMQETSTALANSQRRGTLIVVALIVIGSALSIAAWIAIQYPVVQEILGLGSP